MSIESTAAIPGATLAYKLSGTPGNLPVVVFENGWGASYEQWAWVEPELAAHTQLLFYNRAGIGGSSIEGQQTAARLSLQLKDLLGVLSIRQPVVIAGQSYGGLMTSLHAAQQPQMVRGIVELDPTPQRADPVLDATLSRIGVIANLLILFARLGIPDPIFSPVGKLMPQPAGRELVRKSFGSATSLRGGKAEITLLSGIRHSIAQHRVSCPQLVISAAISSQIKGLAKLLASQKAADALIQRMQALHRSKLEDNPKATWQSMPHDHGGFTFTQAGSKDSAQAILKFIRSL